MTHYDVLGVVRSADLATIRRAYVKLARRLHPDRSDGGDVERMAQVNAAWEVLGNAARRAAYDDTLDPVVVSRPEPEPWQPYDTGNDPEPMPAEDIAVPTSAQRALTMAPAVFFAAGAVSLAVGLVTSVVPFLAFGIVGLLASAASFVLAPVVAMFDSLRDDPDHR